MIWCVHLHRENMICIGVSRNSLHALMPCDILPLIKTAAYAIMVITLGRTVV